MRIAIFSDVHGNLTALETILADIKKQAPDAVAFAGDLCYFGARPAGCIERIKTDVDLFVYGNTDEFLVTQPSSMPDNLTEAQRSNWDAFQQTIDWYRQKLSHEQLAWLGRLPFSHRISPTPNAQDDLLIVHANPKDVNEPIPPPAAEQEALLGKVFIERDEAKMTPLFEGVTAAIIAYGHVHFPNLQQWGEMTLANISATSLPMTKDGIARYGLLTWTKQAGWEVTPRKVHYNFGKEQELLSFLQPPGWKKMSAGLGA